MMSEGTGPSPDIEEAVNREFLRYEVQKQVFCDYTGNVLDVRRTVLVNVDAGSGASYVMDASHWDKVKDGLLEAFPGKVTVVDGREIFGGKK
jgi:hypothetical protein